jgi:hypothetical protein
MEHEAASGFDRTAMVHRTVRSFARLDVELSKEAAERDARPLVADADADRAILVVNAHRDDGALKSRIGHSGHGEKQLARQETRLINHSATMGRSRATGKAIRRRLRRRSRQA